jgi:hypothetical protein
MLPADHAATIADCAATVSFGCTPHATSQPVSAQPIHLLTSDHSCLKPSATS